VCLIAVRAEAGEAAAPIAPNVEHRMDDEMHGEAGATERNADGVDQERPVIGDDLHERVRRLEAVALAIGIEDPDQGLAGGTAPAQLQVRAGCTGEGSRRSLREVFLADASEICPQESLLHLTEESSVRCRGGPALGAGAGASDAFDQRETGRGNAAQKTTVV
jgi:hypothetical protein